MGIEIEELKDAHKVFVAFIPDWTRERAEELRDHIAESFPLGCAVMPEEITSQIVTVPDLGGVRIWSGLDLDPGGYIQSGELAVSQKDGLTYVETAEGAAPAAQDSKPAKSTAGKAAEEKRAILARLKAWREAHGPGCLNVLAKKCGHGITPETLRDLCIGGCEAADGRLAQDQQGYGQAGGRRTEGGGPWLRH